MGEYWRKSWREVTPGVCIWRSTTIFTGGHLWDWRRPGRHYFAPFRGL